RRSPPSSSTYRARASIERARAPRRSSIRCPAYASSGLSASCSSGSSPRRYVLDSGGRWYGGRSSWPRSVTSPSKPASRRVVAAAGAALHGMAVGPGDRVLLLSRNSPDAVRAWLGAMHAGAVPAAVDPRLTPAELRALASDLAPAAVLADAEAAETGGRLAND